MIDVADEFGVPSYLFFPPSAAFLGFLLHLQFLHDYEGLDINEFKDSDAELEVPSFANSVPGKAFPSLMIDKESGGPRCFFITREIQTRQGYSASIVRGFPVLREHGKLWCGSNQGDITCVRAQWASLLVVPSPTSPKGKVITSDYENIEQVLPEGFYIGRLELER
ncbi:hypothetical protein AAG906_003417 [Vitis piasezkii]